MMLNIVFEKCLIILSLSFVNCNPSALPTNSLKFDDPSITSSETFCFNSLS